MIFNNEQIKLIYVYIIFNRVKIPIIINKKLNFILSPLKVFLLTAYKPIENLFESLEEIMKMEKILDASSEKWDKQNDKIPLWFYQMIISMGVSVCIGFILILAGSL